MKHFPAAPLCMVLAQLRHAAGRHRDEARPRVAPEDRRIRGSHQSIEGHTEGRQGSWRKGGPGRGHSFFAKLGYKYDNQHLWWMSSQVGF